MTAPINTSFYADPQGLAALRKDAKAQDPGALKAAAKQFESLFTKMLLKSMREANQSMGSDDLFGSDQAEFYQGMFDDQLAVHMSQGKGLGLADMLVRQLAGGVGQSRQEGAGGLIEGAGNGARGVGQSSEKSEGASSSDLQPTTYGPQPSSSLLHKPQAPSPTPSAGPIASSKEDFINRMLPYAEQAAREIGVDPHALLAQAALETGWGKAVPSNAAGTSSSNLFGIKAGSDWSGATVNVPTLEFEEGVAVRKVERFRAYDSPADSFRDYAGLIRNNPRYEDALGTGSNVAAFASALQSGGYATDPAYAQKIVAVARETRELTANRLKTTTDLPLLASGDGS